MSEASGEIGADHGPRAVRGDHLEALLRRVRLTGRREWSVAIAVLLSPSPLTVRQVAERTGLAYSHAKAIVRDLVAWKILRRGPDGVAFQPDAALWGPPGDPGQGK